MTIYYSAAEGGFYDTRVHGSRTLLIPDPSWVPPRSSVVVEPGEPLPDGSGINEAEEAIRVDIPDETAQAPLIEVLNDACLLPADALEITPERHAELLAGNATGQLIVPDEAGLPMLADPPPPTTEQLAAQATAKRSQLLQQVTQAIAPLQDAVDLGDASSDEEAALLAWKRYRVALNRIEQQDGYPATIEWPVSPEEATA